MRLRLGPGKEIADDGASHHGARSGGKALQGAKEQKPAKGGSQSGAQGTEKIANERNQDDRPTAERVGKCPVEERHERKGEKIDGQRLLDCRQGGGEIMRDGRQRGKVGVDGERSQHGKRRQNDDENTVLHKTKRQP